MPEESYGGEERRSEGKLAYQRLEFAITALREADDRFVDSLNEIRDFIWPPTGKTIRELIVNGFNRLEKEIIQKHRAGEDCSGDVREALDLKIMIEEVLQMMKRKNYENL